MTKTTPTQGRIHQELFCRDGEYRELCWADRIGRRAPFGRGADAIMAGHDVARHERTDGRRPDVDGYISFRQAGHFAQMWAVAGQMFPDMARRVRYMLECYCATAQLGHYAD